MEIDREELIDMMEEYWALDNNPLCQQKTYDFCEKYSLYEVQPYEPDDEELEGWVE